METRHEAAYRVASAIPGRVRVQLAPRSDAESLVSALASRLRRLDGVTEARPATSARSVAVHYEIGALDPSEIEHAISAALDQVLADAHPAREPSTRGSRNGRNGGSGNGRGGGTVRRMADTQSGREPANAGGSQGSEGKGKAAKAQLATSTLAIALSFLEVPLPLVGVLVGLAALPTLKKAQKAARQRRIEMSQLDLLTATTLAAMGDMRSAAEVLWITGLADVMHDSGIKGLRRKMAEIAPTPGLPAAEQRKLAAMLQQAPIGTTRTERTIRALADRLAAPLVGVAALVFALTRSPLRAANVLKFADIDSGIRITTPEAVLNALAVAAREGIFIRGGRPLEALAAVDAVVIDSPLSGPTAEQLGDAAGALLARGVARLVVRSGAHTEPIRRAAESLGAADAVEETDDPASAVQSLRRAGFRPALLWDGGPAPGGARDAAVCISLGGEGRVEDEAAEVVLLDGGVARLGDAIDLARRTTHVLRQNVGLVLGPTAAGLIAAVAGMTSPIATTLITNGSAALAGVNSLRPLGHTSQQEAPSKAPAALDRAAQPAG